MTGRCLPAATVVAGLPALSVYGQRCALPDSLIDLRTVQGERLLRESDTIEPNIPLCTSFVTQKT
jgi:hypothetical protein